MAAKKKIRLFKIASEINIGKDAIVAFLTSKGYEIENKPTASLTLEMVELVYEKFKREKRAAEKQREKLQKHKDIRKAAVDRELPGKDEEPAEVVAKEELIDKKEKVVEEEKPPIEIEEVKEPEVTEEVAEATTEEESDGPKVGEVIEIPTGKKPAKAKAKPKAKTSKKKETEEAEAEAEEKPKAKKTTAKRKPAAKKDTAKKESDTEAAVEEIETADKTDEVVPDAKILEEHVKETEADVPDEEKELDEVKDSKRKKRRKSKKLVEVELEPGKTPQLPGLTIVGKIDIQANKKKEKKRITRKKKPGETEELDIKEAKQQVGKKKTKTVSLDKITDKPKEDKKKRKRKKSIREQITQEEVDKAIKKTLAGMGEHHTVSRSKIKQKRKAEREEKESKIMEEKEKADTILRLTEFVTTSDLANLMNESANDIILKCMQLGLMVTINQRLDKDTITLIAVDYGYEVQFIEHETIGEEVEEEELEEDLKPRSPIVTIMGHVDHGKTSLLDYIRHANVVAGEAGGITQHIAAYRVRTKGNKHITFLDTPGHEAFTAMRARGAQVTDIVVLVVAADDSVMPQTLEAISHAQAASVPIVVAINKIDKPDARPDRIKQQLSDHNILIEEWGGTYQCVELSAKSGLNVDQLLEKILLEAEMLELKANPDRIAKGVVIESHMSKGLGTVATLIVQKGTLNVGDPFVTGVFSGRVRAMLDERGNKVTEAGPSIPVGVIGFDGLPEAGDQMIGVISDSEARSISTHRQQLKREQELRQVRHVTLDEISQQIQIGGVQDLNLVIKGDVAGSVEALSDSLQKLSREEVRVSILHKAVGNINESDVMLAVASGAVIIGFQVSITAKARKIAEKEKVDIRLYSIIYDCINEVQMALEGLLKPDLQEEVTSTVEIRKVFKISRMGNIAGCYVTNGKITRNDKIRVLRDGFSIFEGGIHSLKRNKDDAKEVGEGFECGIQVEGFNDIQEGDIIESFKIIEIKRTLD